jgi:transposase
VRESSSRTRSRLVTEEGFSNKKKGRTALFHSDQQTQQAASHLQLDLGHTARTYDAPSSQVVEKEEGVWVVGLLWEKIFHEKGVSYPIVGNF